MAITVIFNALNSFAQIVLVTTTLNGSEQDTILFMYICAISKAKKKKQRTWEHQNV